MNTKHRAKVESLLDPGESLVALIAVSSGTSVGQVAGRDMTLGSVADYLRAHDLVALGLPSQPPHAFASGWVAATDRRVAFVVAGWLWPSPKTLPYSVPLERVRLQWGDATSLGTTTRLYHFTYEHTNGKSLDLVRRGAADADADAFVKALGPRATAL